MSRFVYFVRPVGAEGPVKIGCSVSPQSRLDQLMTWSPLPLEIAATVPGHFSLERNIHSCFADLHSHREWFRADPRLSEVIRKLQDGVPITSALDLDARVGNIRRSSKSAQWLDPEARRRASYQQRMSWASRKADTGDNYFCVPDDVDAIFSRWRGWTSYQNFVAKRVPSEAEIARLERVIAEPRKYMISRARKVPLAA